PRLAPAAAPSPRCWAAMATDPVRGEIVLFGGVTGTNPFPPKSDETWTWDGLSWTLGSPQTVPFASSFGVLVAIPHRPRLLLAGGSAGSFPVAIDGSYLWEWDGTDWTRLPVLACRFPARRLCAAPEPSAGSGLALEHDQSLRGTHMWSWDGVAWTEILPS